MEEAIPVPLTKAGWMLAILVDILVALGVSWQLLRLELFFTTSKSIVRKILICTVISGVLPTLAGIALVILIRSPHGAGVIILTNNYQKMYGITVFANVAVVQAMKQRSTVIFVNTGGVGQSVKLPSFMSAFRFNSASETTAPSESINISTPGQLIPRKNQPGSGGIGHDA
jgi:hypothetical protein